MSIMHNGEKVLNNLTTVPITQTINASSKETEIPSAKAVYDSAIKDKSLKTYTSLSQLGLSDGCSVEDIFLALPYNSYFEIGTASSISGYATITNLPTTSTSTLLTIRKYTQARFDIRVKLSSSNAVDDNELYIGQLKGNDGTGLTWQRVCTTSVADTSGIATLPDNVTGTISYKVINGVCYVSIQGLADGLTGLEVVTFAGLPKADVYISISIENSGNYAGTIYSVDGVTFYVHKSVAGGGYGSFSYPVAES